jgi:hypothetical protein
MQFDHSHCLFCLKLNADRTFVEERKSIGWIEDDANITILAICMLCFLLKEAADKEAENTGEKFQGMQILGDHFDYTSPAGSESK